MSPTFQEIALFETLIWHFFVIPPPPISSLQSVVSLETERANKKIILTEKYILSWKVKLFDCLTISEANTAPKTKKKMHL